MTTAIRTPEPACAGDAVHRGSGGALRKQVRLIRMNAGLNEPWRGSDRRYKRELRFDRPEVRASRRLHC
jgi:hypothetical protein